MIDIRLDNISKTYASGGTKTAAVDGVNLHIQAGEFFFLLGPSGCGKTTLLRMIAGLVEPTDGRVFFGERDVTALPVERRNAAMVFQNYALWPHMTVAQNVQFAPKMQGKTRDESQTIANESLARVQMEEYVARKPSQLSGGQQQRIALARALAARGQCLLLDEPLSNLDARLRLHMRGQLRQLVKSTGVTAVYVTHDQKEALSMADRIAVMDAGKIVQIGTPQEIYNRPATVFVADFLGEANFVKGKIASAGPLARIATSVGELLAGCPACPPIGAEVTVCVRPEHLTIQPVDRSQASKESSALPAEIASSMYLGEIRQYTCHLADGTVWRVSLLADSSAPLPAGTKVTLACRYDNAVILSK